MNKLFKEIVLLPNLISLFRMLLFIPLLILFNLMRVDSSYKYYILLVIFIAYLSDILDGFVARRNNQISELGKIIDPLADKVLVALIVLNLFLMNLIPPFYFWIVILRDLFIFFGGVIVSKKMGKVLPSNRLGKITVFSIGILIIATLLQNNSLSGFYNGIMITSVILCFASLIGYSIRAIEILKWNKNEIVR